MRVVVLSDRIISNFDLRAINYRQNRRWFTCYQERTVVNGNLFKVDTVRIDVLVYVNVHHRYARTYSRIYVRTQTRAPTNRTLATRLHHGCHTEVSQRGLI